MLPPSLLSFSQEPFKAILYLGKKPPGARAQLLFPLDTISVFSSKTTGYEPGCWPNRT